jgi:DNA-binding NarL/FixJ family response regulator
MLERLRADITLPYAVLSVCMPTNRNIELHHPTMTSRDGETALAVPRILLADDRQEVLKAINAVLGDEFNVIGTVRDGRAAVELTTSLRPDVLLLDISMPVVNGIEAASCLKKLGSDARIIFLTVYSDPEFLEAVLSTGAVGYVVKTAIATDLVPAIWAVLNGKVFISPSMNLQ